MSIHPPIFESSVIGLGPETKKSMNFLEDGSGIGIEDWGNLASPWKIGDTIIANPNFRWITHWVPGQEYVITQFFTPDQQWVGTYCDITRPVQRIEGGFTYEDIYLDVWRREGDWPEILDEHELEMGVQEKFITIQEAHRARSIAQYLLVELTSDASSILNFSNRQKL